MGIWNLPFPISHKLLQILIRSISHVRYPERHLLTLLLKLLIKLPISLINRIALLGFFHFSRKVFCLFFQETPGCVFQYLLRFRKVKIHNILLVKFQIAFHPLGRPNPLWAIIFLMISDVPLVIRPSRESL